MRIEYHTWLTIKYRENAFDVKLSNEVMLLVRLDLWIVKATLLLY